MPTEKLDLLREALPYIRRFKGRTFVVKIGGKLTEDADVLRSIATEIALCQQVGFRMVVVHGGGKQLSDLAEKLGIPQTMVNGRRITDSETLEIAKMVFAGKIRTDILSVLRGLGLRTVGLSGLDGNIVRARKREIQKVINRETGQEEWIDFGHVGDILEVDGALLRQLIDQGYLPVVSSLGADDEGNVYNINADTVASEVAVHLGAEKLILMSTVDGIYTRTSSGSEKISRISLEEAEKLLQSDQITEGMLPKLSSIVALLKRGVHSAHIINGFRRNSLLQEIFTDQGTGTMVSLQPDDASGIG